MNSYDENEERNTTNADMHCRKRDICSLFVGVQIAAVTKETGVEVPPKARN